MNNNRLIKTGISQGDINGISYELILKTFEDARIFELCIPVLYGSSKTLAYHRKALDLPPVNFSNISTPGDAGINRLNIINSDNREINVELASATQESEQAATKALQQAFQDLKQKNIDVLVTAPANLNEMSIIEDSSLKDHLNLLVYNSFRVAIATDKIPLNEISSLLTTDYLSKKIKMLHSVLVRDFMITIPRIAVLSFNPGVGIKEQRFEKEETETIIPAIQSVAKEGILCFGPYAAESLFDSDDYKNFDAILAIYNDQGQLPFRTLSNGEGVLYRANPKYVMTTPDQSVSYEKAGKNNSNEAAFRNAIYTALDIFRNRKIDAEINANPLKKLYFERGSDNEKLDLTADED